ncbi:FtsK/SpoIIIE domain-containing protein [Pseudarthrobacter sp. MDT3-26]|uniref:FtsK/SpoIIIE domain-containing protein n=1 Tax=Pseudarthrobacter raffinosi TaxID=2953651 RepID=UPI00208F3FF1|nr:FtsK/SpoIIIE domain-containing protein [Pseudarthrobacter sp. MDT3-26]MCO4263720.1 FtsK/SpoIIIE domain-containing protein [Pseudarthrobacter sp. MDT3-26]
MLSFLKPRNKAFGFTSQDDEVAMAYLALVKDNDVMGATALLDQHGWTFEHFTAVLDHFHPERVYSDAEMAAARAAVALMQGKDEKGAKKLLKKLKLDTKDVSPAVEQYWAAFGLDDSVEAGAAGSDGAGEAAFQQETSVGAVERMFVDVPAEYQDSIEERAKLVAALWRKFGSDWQVESFNADSSEVEAVRGERPAMRPGASVYGAGPSATTGNGAAIAAEHTAHGRTMLGYDPFKREVEVAVLPPATLELRNRLLRKLPKQNSWELELLPIFGVRDGVGHLAQVIISRADTVSPERAKEHAHWLGLAKTVIGHNGWWVKIDDATGVVTMNAGVPIKVPSRAPYDFDVIESGKWGELVVGRDAYNKPVIVDLAATPHALVVGRTGSGKSIFIQTMIFSALVHGFDLAILDPSKRGLDFRWARPYVRDGGWGCQNFPEALEAIKGVYAEATRRLEILDGLNVPKWNALSKEDQAKYGISPILVVLDEGTSLAKLISIPKTLEKEDPLYLEMTEMNSSKELILMYVGKILRECRFVGIHLIFGTQRFGVQEIGQGAGELRENMPARIILGRTSTSSLAMACADPQDAAEAYEIAHGFATADQDPSDTEREATPGRGLAEIDGRGHVALQGAYAPENELVERLVALEVPRYEGDRRPIVLERESPFGTVEPAPTYFKPVENEVVDLEEMALSLDDLEEDSTMVETLVEIPELDWSAAFETDAPDAPAPADPDWDEPPAAAPATPAWHDEDDDPFADKPARPETRVAVPDEDDDPFGGTPPAKPKPKIDFEW